MISRKACSCLASALLCLGMGAADAPASLRVKALPLGDRGVVEDLTLSDWKVEVGGRLSPVLAQRLPAETGKIPQKWVFVLLPVRGPEFRAILLQAIATFMTTLPASDSVLVVLRSPKGLECLTPGFTTRPSLWAQALTVAQNQMGGSLKGNPEAAFTLSPSPAGEKEEAMAPIAAFLAQLDPKKMEKRSDDIVSYRSSLAETYSPMSLGTYAGATVINLKALELLGEAVARESGEKHLVLFSRNEIDDMGNPIWGRIAVHARSRDTMNSKLQAEAMIRDVTLAQIALKNKLVQLGLDLHTVAAPSGNYFGAFSEIASATGGNTYPLREDLPMRLSQVLPFWGMRYELTVALPSGTTQPAVIAVDSPRKGVRVFAPRLQ